MSMADTTKSANTKVEIFETHELALPLADYVADLSNKFIKERGAFTVALSGGSLIHHLRSLYLFIVPFVVWISLLMIGYYYL